jgi:hypothetical protein
MYFVCFCARYSELNLYNELKFQHLEKTSNVELNKRIMWNHNKVIATCTLLLMEKQTRLGFHVSVKIADFPLELEFYMTGNLNDVIIDLYLNKWMYWS